MCSSVGSSTDLISLRSWVQVPPHPPQFNNFLFMNNDNSWQPTEIISPNVDVYKVDNKVCIVIMISGATAKDLDINFHKNTFTVKGMCVKPYSKDVTTLLGECKWGPFEREIVINENLDVENIKAVLNHGVLSIEIPVFKILETKKIELTN